jgi:outer membrane protein
MKSFNLSGPFGKAVCASVLLVALTSAVQAEEIKIGYVNSDRVLSESALAKAAQTKLETEFSKRQKEGEEAANRLKLTADKLDKEGPALSEAERSRRQRELVDQDRDLQRKRREFQEDLNVRQNEERATVVGRVNKVIKQIYETEKYDLILQDAVFAGARVDITDKVIKALNSQSFAK